MDCGDEQRTTRRAVLFAAGAAGIAAVLAVRPAAATSTTMQAAIRRIVGEAGIKTGKVKFDVPPIVENGNTVPITVSVQSPMTAGDYVKAIHVVNEKNLQPNVISVHLGPRAGRATVSTRIRLADSQKLVAIAEMSDGSFWSESVEVIVTLAACLEEFK